MRACAARAELGVTARQIQPRQRQLGLEHTDARLRDGQIGSCARELGLERRDARLCRSQIAALAGERLASSPVMPA